MKKFVLCIKTPMTYNAGSKAVMDATNIAIGMGYKKIFYARTFPTLLHNKYFQFLNKLINLILCIFASIRVSKKNTYFVQWPSPGKSTKILFKTLIRKHAKIIVLIHDLNALRGIVFPEDELIMYSMLEAADTIIVHTDSMRDYLKSNGVDEKKMHILYTFDYLTDESIPERIYSNEVAFAGNLSKSTFLRNVNIDRKDLIFYCYGASYNNDYSGIEYKGKFSPNNVSQIQGSWGLVWDGDSTKSCTGEFGDYLKYNSPHKVSLYIVAELPIIIWEEQALARYVTDRNIGIVVSSLEDIPNKISNISEDMYQEMRNNIKEEAEILKNGYNLKRFL